MHAMVGAPGYLVKMRLWAISAPERRWVVGAWWSFSTSLASPTLGLLLHAKTHHYLVKSTLFWFSNKCSQKLFLIYILSYSIMKIALIIDLKCIVLFLAHIKKPERHLATITSSVSYKGVSFPVDLEREWMFPSLQSFPVKIFLLSSGNTYQFRVFQISSLLKHNSGND